MPFPPIKSELLMLLSWFFELSSAIVSWFHNGGLAISFHHVLEEMPLKKINLGLKEDKVVQEDISLLDLPELALECILERLSPSGLCSMAAVCCSLRDTCTSDHLWQRHLKQKWGKLIGSAACKEWQHHISSKQKLAPCDQINPKSLVGSIMGVWPFSWISPNCETRVKKRTSIPHDSAMALYLSLQSGKFCFPAQVYNRENGHAGFMLSCYDARISYDSQTDTFRARYSPYGRLAIEESIDWKRLREPPIDTPAKSLHISDCLDDLKPGDHVEIQWRRSKEFPYGWWYAVVGHLESCNGNENHCQCHCSDRVVLEFNQYIPGSRWRQTTVNRKDHREEGNEADGFYGGIRKLYKEEEISMWKQLWPKQVFE